ncbi:MAG: SRPBCC domain-containing protein [Gemmataceae bacterium]
MKTATATKLNGISSEAVCTATGKTWDEWLAALDAEGCRTMTHREIVAVVAAKFDVGPWWRQMVTVGYEQGRGLRRKHQKPDGYQISRNKTLAVDVGEAFAAWKEPRKRRRWLADAEFTVRKATENKSLRLTWVDGTTTLEVNFYVKGAGKCQVSVQHNKLGGARAAQKMKAYWGEQLERLKETIEG